MRDIDNGPLIIGIPSLDQGRFGTVALLKKAEIPVRDRIGYSLEQSIWFDRFAQAVRRPSEDQKVDRVNITTFDARGLKELVQRGIFDMAIRPRAVPLEGDRPDALGLIIPGRTRSEVLAGELILGEPINPEVVDQARGTGELRGIEGFRNRLVASIVRASEQVAQEAFASSLELTTKKATANYQAIKEGERPYLPY